MLYVFSNVWTLVWVIQSEQVHLLCVCILSTPPFLASGGSCHPWWPRQCWRPYTGCCSHDDLDDASDYGWVGADAPNTFRRFTQAVLLHSCRTFCCAAFADQYFIFVYTLSAAITFLTVLKGGGLNVRWFGFFSHFSHWGFCEFDLDLITGQRLWGAVFIYSFMMWALRNLLTLNLWLMVLEINLTWPELLSIIVFFSSSQYQLWHGDAMYLNMKYDGYLLFYPFIMILFRH